MLFVLSLLLSTAAIESRAVRGRGLPVVLVPGFGGSQIEANLTGKPEVVHYVCARQTSEFFDLWLNLQLFVPQVIDCWTDNMQLVYNISAGTSTNMPGVQIRVPGLGLTDSIEWLDKSKASQGRYFTDIVEFLVARGYTRTKSVVGAPFDWRKGPYELNEYFLHLKTLIETTYRWNGNQKVVLIGHSMGNPITLFFLNYYVDQTWKDKHVASWVSLAAPWGGSGTIVKLFAYGYNMNYYRVILPPSSLRAMQRSFTSSAFLFPSSTAWEMDEVLAMTDVKNYTLNNVKEFFMDMNYATGWEQYKKSGRLLAEMKPPGVAMHCVYGSGVDTPEMFKWAKGYFPDYAPAEIYGDGDGTVNKKSARVCEQWQRQGHEVTIHEIYKADHMGILKDANALDVIQKAIYQSI